ncbi:MAG: hypothetical protein AABZ44_07710, partial [Elusimicrobiota bacterium]
MRRWTRDEHAQHPGLKSLLTLAVSCLGVLTGSILGNFVEVISFSKVLDFIRIDVFDSHGVIMTNLADFGIYLTLPMLPQLVIFCSTLTTKAISRKAKQALLWTAMTLWPLLVALMATIADYFEYAGTHSINILIEMDTFSLTVTAIGSLLATLLISILGRPRAISNTPKATLDHACVSARQAAFA